MALDSQIKNLALAIRQQESGGKYDARGPSGEYGAYQFMPETWNLVAPKYLGSAIPLDKATPNDQNKVAYNYVKELASRGYKPSQIAAAWNAGEGSIEGDKWKTNVGTNSSGVHYDTPAYVSNVGKYYKQYSAGEIPTPGTSVTPPTTVGEKPSTTEPQADTYNALIPASSNDNPLKAGLKSAANVPSSFLTLVDGLINAGVHPINTLRGLGNVIAGAGEKLGRAIINNTALGDVKLTNGMSAKEHLAQLSPDEQEATFNSLTEALKNRYGSLENAQRTATNDPIGFGSDIFTILEGGAGLIDTVAGTSTRAALDTAVTAVAKPVINISKKIATAPFSIGAKILGQSTGVGSEAIKTGFNATAKGGEASKAFTEGLRGNTTPEDLVNKARGALDEVIDTRRSNYKEMLKTLKSDVSEIDTTSLTDKLDNQLESFNIKRTPEGELNFSESTIVRPSDQREIEAMVKDVENWKDTTPAGIDTLKQRLSNYWEPGSKTGAFSEGLRSEARKLVENTPGYSDAMRNYSEMSDTIKDIKQSLSLGDKAAVETSFTKLKNALKNNKEFRQQVLRELDEATGGTLMESIAGQNMSGIAPRGLAKYADIGAGITALSHGVGILPLLGLAVTTSPRIVGEIIGALGLGAKATKFIMNDLNKLAVPIIVGGAAGSKANSNP